VTPTSDARDRRRITLQLSDPLIQGIDRLRQEWGMRSRGDAVERLLGELLVEQTERPTELHEPEQSAAEDIGSGQFDESGAIVLIAQPRNGDLAADFVDRASDPLSPPPRASLGVDLPGFVRRRSDQLKQSLKPRAATGSNSGEALPLVDDSCLHDALLTVDRHWIELYGKAPNEMVVEAAMAWLSLDIWPQVEVSEGRPFTWSLLSLVVDQLAPAWTSGPPTLARVVVAAGLLEDPFGGASLSARVPTLIRRFVHRYRRRQRGTSFEALDNTMSLHGALKLLQLPTSPGHRLTLGDIREAYRQQALLHHPDSGGSPEQMRRLNEAYQMLKELYRTP